MKERYRGHEADFQAASPLFHISPDAPPFFIIHGRNDSLVPVSEARAFALRLREVSRSPVIYAELPVTQHAFEVFPSIRTAHVIAGAERFADFVYTAYLVGLRQADTSPAPAPTPGEP